MLGFKLSRASNQTWTRATGRVGCVVVQDPNFTSSGVSEEKRIGVQVKQGFC